MRIPELKNLKKMRKNSGLSQTELARMCGVSQSFIARLESGRSDPPYSKIKNIHETLSRRCNGNIMTKAGDVMNRKIISIEQSRRVREAAVLMKKKNISQLPVIENGIPTGSISERTIVEKIAAGGINDISKINVSEIMEETFPIMDQSISIDIISMVLEYQNAVLVSKKGRLVGIVTKADIIKLL